MHFPCAPSCWHLLWLRRMASPMAGSHPFLPRDRSRGTLDRVLLLLLFYKQQNTEPCNLSLPLSGPKAAYHLLSPEMYGGPESSRGAELWPRSSWQGAKQRGSSWGGSRSHCLSPGGQDVPRLLARERKVTMSGCKIPQIHASPYSGCCGKTATKYTGMGNLGAPPHHALLLPS